LRNFVILMKTGQRR